MSRDWTPRESYEVEQHNIKTGQGFGTLWDFFENSVWKIGDRTIPLCTPENLARRKEYPNLGRLYESYDELYAFLSKTPGGLDFLAQQDKALETYITSGKGDKSSPLIKWFEGELDTHFYYRERNDELLFEYFQEEIEKQNRNTQKPSLADRIRNAVEQKAAAQANGIVYLIPDTEHTWSVHIGDSPSTETAIPLAQEGTYPVDLIYDRVDMNGSKNLDSIPCKNRQDLVDSLNWVGKCRFPTFSFWDFDSSCTDNEKAIAVLSDAFSYRHKLIMQDMEEMFFIAPPEKNTPDTRER